MIHLDFEKKDSNLLFVNDTLNGAHIAVAARNCNTVFYGGTQEKIRRGEKWVVHFQSGVSPDKIFMLNQLHGDSVFIADTPVDPAQMYAAEADALITTMTGTALVIRTADCYAIMLSAPGGTGAVHSGWRGTQKNITGKTVSLLAQSCGCDPKNIRAYVMPGIGLDSYEVKDDVAQFFPSYIEKRDNRLYLNLKAAIVKQLYDAGLTRNNIFTAYHDTYTFKDLFFSHRRGDEGRNLNYIVMR